jgi:hypothetical protein
VQPRETISTYGPNAGASGRQRAFYVTPDFAIGSASADYSTNEANDQDALLLAEFMADFKTPVMTVIADYLDAPGARVGEGDFVKVTHLPMAPAAAQKGGTVLALLRVPARDPKYTAPDGAAAPLVSLATNIVFPATAEVIVDGNVVDTTKDTVLTGTPTVAVHLGTGVVAARIVSASGLECPSGAGVVASTSPDVHIKPLAAATTTAGATARLVVYHDTTLPSDTSTLASCFARVALVLAGAPCSGASCAQAVAASVAAWPVNEAWSAANGDWDVRVDVPNGPSLHVHRAIATKDQVLAREVNGQTMLVTPLAVNGVTIALP